MTGRRRDKRTEKTHVWRHRRKQVERRMDERTGGRRKKKAGKGKKEKETSAQEAEPELTDAATHHDKEGEQTPKAVTGKSAVFAVCH